MSLFNRILSLCLLCIMLFSLSSCREYKPSQGGNGGAGSYPDGSEEQPELDNDPTNDFTVQLVFDGKPFIPNVSISVYWNDGYSIYSAPVDKTGKAVIDGLDGDYRVTLSSAPAGYAYDPNSEDHIATNDNRNVNIIMYDLNTLRGSGTSLYSCYEINRTGVYTVTVSEPGQMIYIEFGPEENGMYSVESWANTVDDEIRPICIYYNGHSQFKDEKEGKKVTKVGPCGSYTRNFIHEVNIADENMSVSGGSQTFTFAVTAEAKNGVYPVQLTFAVKRNGSFDLERIEKITVLPTDELSGFDFDAFNALAGGKIVGAETLYEGSSDTYVFDEKNYKLWPVSAGGDGVYHVYDPEKYSETDGYGPVLVAYITGMFRFSLTDKDGTALSFVTLDDKGNSLVVDGRYNYRLFIRGIKSLADGGRYCVKDCLCHLDGSTPVCVVGCKDCHPDCIQCPEEQINVKGYADYVNGDGVAPVTEELKQFLQLYASKSGYYFTDGEGAIETDPDHPIYSDEASQWLFACGYYE